VDEAPAGQVGEVLEFLDEYGGVSYRSYSLEVPPGDWEISGMTISSCNDDYIIADLLQGIGLMNWWNPFDQQSLTVTDFVMQGAAAGMVMHRHWIGPLRLNFPDEPYGYGNMTVHWDLTASSVSVYSVLFHPGGFLRARRMR
jgi:hypothetical protein